MTILLLLLSITGIALFFLQSTSPYRNLFGGVGLASSVLLLLLRVFGGGPESIDYLERFEEAVGAQMANALIEQIPEGGTVLILPLAPELEAHRKLNDTLTGTFLRELEGSGWTPIVSTHENLPGQIPPVGASPGIFASELKNHPEATAVVSFIGLPMMDPTQWPDTPLLAQEIKMTNRVADWKQQPAVRALITLQDEVDSTARPQGRDLQKVFDLRYQLYTP